MVLKLLLRSIAKAVEKRCLTAMVNSQNKTKQERMHYAIEFQFVIVCVVGFEEETKKTR